jgi:polyisoprenoid-binding protein YceI
MKKSLLPLALVLATSVAGFAQKFFTRDAKIKFNSDTPMEKIEGTNKNGTCVLDAATGKMEWKVLVKGFQFEKALMQEHFNENYMESSKFPNAIFSGTINNLNEVNLAKDGTYNTKVKGKMTIHGVSKDIEVPGNIKVSGGNAEVNANFSVTCADYNIAIPALVKDNIAKEIKVAVSALLKPIK